MRDILAGVDLGTSSDIGPLSAYRVQHPVPRESYLEREGESCFHAPETTRLIINSQTGQWGTAYDESQDFARIVMNREQLDEAVERFTIAIEPTDAGADLQLRWNRTQFSVPITIR